MIGRKIGQTTGSVTYQTGQLAKYMSPMSKLAPVPSDMELSKSEAATLEARLHRIIHGLMKADKTEQWNRILKATPRAEWVQQILALIPTPVGRILAGRSPPTIAELSTLAWEHSSNFGAMPGF